MDRVQHKQGPWWRWRYPCGPSKGMVRYGGEEGHAVRTLRGPTCFSQKRRGKQLGATSVLRPEAPFSRWGCGPSTPRNRPAGGPITHYILVGRTHFPWFLVGSPGNNRQPPFRMQPLSPRCYTFLEDPPAVVAVGATLFIKQPPFEFPCQEDQGQVETPFATCKPILTSAKVVAVLFP